MLEKRRQMAKRKMARESASQMKKAICPGMPDCGGGPAMGVPLTVWMKLIMVKPLFVNSKTSRFDHRSIRGVLWWTERIVGGAK
jgi:hypothetical protein